MTDVVIESRDGRGITTLAINRPDRRNALDAEVIESLTAAFGRIAEDPSVRVVVVAGTGPVFCAGVDFDWLRRAATQDDAENRQDSESLAALYHAVDSCTQPVLAQVQGGAYAGGCSLIAACDVVVASDDARFAITEARLGLTPSLMLPYMMGRVGLRQIRRYCLTGETFDAETARRVGLVSLVVSQGSLDAKIAELADALLRCAPESLVQTKALVREWTRPPVTETAVALSVEAFAQGRGGDEAREGLAARQEGRSAAWTARP